MQNEIDKLKKDLAGLKKTTHNFFKTVILINVAILVFQITLLLLKLAGLWR